jgi:acetate---CoA ligase (ADP-forming)
VAYPVNRDGQPVSGVPGYTSIEAISGDVDLAVICLPATAVAEAAEAALRAGVKALCVISAGFAEIGRDGAERQERLLALVRAHGARLLGPNCLGITAALINHDPTSIHEHRAARHAEEDNEPEELPPFGSKG